MISTCYVRVWGDGNWRSSDSVKRTRTRMGRCVPLATWQCGPRAHADGAPPGGRPPAGPSPPG
eukprot:6521421-Pyramimonas_sp.AAC.2